MNTSRSEADHTTRRTTPQEGRTTAVDGQGAANQTLDEATARATAIHDGAERLLSLLSTRHPRRSAV